MNALLTFSRPRSQSGHLSLHYRFSDKLDDVFFSILQIQELSIHDK